MTGLSTAYPGGNLANVVEDQSPELGGDLDLLTWKLVKSTLTDTIYQGSYPSEHLATYGSWTKIEQDYDTVYTDTVRPVLRLSAQSNSALSNPATLEIIGTYLGAGGEVTNPTTSILLTSDNFINYATSIQHPNVTGFSLGNFNYPVATTNSSEFLSGNGQLLTIALNTLTDVTISSSVPGHVIFRNAGNTAYVNGTLGDAGIAAASHNHAASDVNSGTFADARIATSNVTQHQASLSIAATQLTGTLADARVAQSNVTQHQAALSITESQISDLQTYSLSTHAHAINDITDVVITANATGHLLRFNGTNFVNTLLGAGDIPTLDTSKIGTGTFADARISSSSVTQHLGGHRADTTAAMYRTYRKNTTQTITDSTATGTWYQISLDTSVQGTLGGLSTNDFNVPADGIYIIHASAGFDLDSTGMRQVAVTVTGSGPDSAPVPTECAISSFTGGANFDTYGAVTLGPISLLSTDVIGLYVRQNSGGNLNIIEEATWLTVRRLDV